MLFGELNILFVKISKHYLRCLLVINVLTQLTKGTVVFAPYCSGERSTSYFQVYDVGAVYFRAYLCKQWSELEVLNDHTAATGSIFGNPLFQCSLNCKSTQRLKLSVMMHWWFLLKLVASPSCS